MTMNTGVCVRDVLQRRGTEMVPSTTGGCSSPGLQRVGYGIQASPML